MKLEAQVVTAQPVYTIGHSTRTIGEFLALLQAGNVELIIDVRSVPRSKTNPQFNRDTMPQALAPWKIVCAPMPELGGLRGKSCHVLPGVNGYWNNASFHNYADYALSGEFDRGLSQLLDLSRDRRSAVMCAEAVWWRCHRRIVADYLLHRGRSVFHLMGRAAVIPAVMNKAAIEMGGALVYPAQRSIGIETDG